MKKIFIIILVLAAACLAHTANYYPKEMIIGFADKPVVKNNKTNLENLNSAIDDFGVKTIFPLVENQNLHIYKIRCKEKIDFIALNSIVEDSKAIKYIQPNRLNQFFSIVPNDPLYFQQSWCFEDIKADKTWEYEKGNDQIVMGLIDSGIDYNHPDLAENIWINKGEIPDNGIDDDGNGFIDDWQGWDFTDTELTDVSGDATQPDNNPMDKLGHGTHCAGIMNASTNNEMGVSGTSWFSKTMNLRAGFNFGGVGFLEDDDVTAAIVYATDNGAQVINMSWGDITLSPVISAACQYAYERGVVLIAASGNDEAGSNDYKLFYPAALENVISVGATDQSHNRCSFSCYGEGLDLVAPGLNITSTWLENDYKVQSGTSTSAPFVVGSTALLLSSKPELTNAEVYTLLKNSCTDIGPDGYDNEFGYGMINSNELIYNSALENFSNVFIDSPDYSQGFSANFPVVGNAMCQDFLRYSLTYTTENIPAEEDWRDIRTHNPPPEYHYEEIAGDTLGNFLVSGLTDTTYYVRLLVEDKFGKKYNDIVKIHLDQSEPEFLPNANGFTSRYNFDKLNYYLLSAADEPVRFFSNCFTASGDTTNLINKKFSRTSSLKLPGNLPSDEYSFFTKITNRSELSNYSQIFTDAFTIDNSTINTNFLEKTLTYHRPAFLCGAADVNPSDDKSDLVFMELPETGLYGPVIFAQKEDEKLVEKYRLPKKFKPMTVGDSNGDGKIEVAGNSGDTLIVYESELANGYPNNLIYYGTDISALLGVVLYDVDADGEDELLANSQANAQKTPSTAYKIYNREGDDFVYSNNLLLNNTATHFQNQLTAKPQFGYLDDDNKLDILLSDIDGDVLIFEVKNQNPLEIELADTLQVPIMNAYYSTIGDFNGNGNNEFLVGGFFDESSNPDAQYWSYSAFSSYADDQYEIIDILEIAGVSSSNGICSANIDADARQEAIITAAPDIYALEMIGDKLTPKWVGKSFRSFYPQPIDLTNDGIEEIAFNQLNNDSLKLVVYQSRSDIPDVSTPENFDAVPLDSGSVKLSWNQQNNVLGFKIYQHSHLTADTFLVDSLATEFISTNLLADTTYNYKLTAFRDEESLPTREITAVPSPKPAVDSIKMISPTTLEICFSTDLHLDATNLQNYQIEDLGYPVSAIRTNNFAKIILNFAHKFTSEYSPYALQLENLKSKNRVSMVDTIVYVNFRDDVFSPYVVNSTLPESNLIKITFSENVSTHSATEIENYQLEFPENFDNIFVTNVTHSGKEVQLELSQNLKPTNGFYFVKVKNVNDLSGNKILPGKNLVKIAIPITDLKSLLVGPNPSRPEHENVYFQNLPTRGKAKLHIYNFSGDLIKKITSPQLSSNYNTISWDKNNNAGKRIASGIYFYLIKYNDKYKKGTIAIIN